MKKLILFICLITMTGCGKLTQLYDTTQDTINKQNQINSEILDKLNNTPTQNSTQPATNYPPPQIIIVTPPPTVIIINPAQQPKNAPVLKIERVKHDMTLSWTDVHAESYTVYQNFYSPQLDYMWVKVTTFTGFNMFFPNVYEHGTHHYKVQANFEDGTTRSSVITFTGQE